MKLYHFSNSNITEFKFTQPERSYTMATGYGIYFTTNYEGGKLKYGNNSKYCYECDYEGDEEKILDLGEFDALYFKDTQRIHYGTVVTSNWKKYCKGKAQELEPELILETLSEEAFQWSLDSGYEAIHGMQGDRICDEFIVLVPLNIAIIKKIKL